MTKNNEVVVGQSKTQIKDDVKPVLVQEFKKIRYSTFLRNDKWT
ncbi:hypothetical protein [Spiroplasma citri]|nr:hypothetical protein [Spiroplasma citri]